MNPIATITPSAGTFTLSLQPLYASDRVTYAGSPLVFGPFDAASTTITLPGFSVPGETNPLSTSELTFGEVTLSRGEASYMCGTVGGSIIFPITQDLTGGTFTMVPLAEFVEPPMLDCYGTLATPVVAN